MKPFNLLDHCKDGDCIFGHFIQIIFIACVIVSVYSPFLEECDTFDLLEECDATTSESELESL